MGSPGPKMAPPASAKALGISQPKSQASMLLPQAPGVVPAVVGSAVRADRASLGVSSSAGTSGPAQQRGRSPSSKTAEDGQLSSADGVNERRGISPQPTTPSNVQPKAPPGPKVATVSSSGMLSYTYGTPGPTQQYLSTWMAAPPPPISSVGPGMGRRFGARQGA